MAEPLKTPLLQVLVSLESKQQLLLETKYAEIEVPEAIVPPHGLVQGAAAGAVYGPALRHCEPLQN